MLGQLCLNRPNLLSFPTVVSMTLMPRVDIMMDMWDTLQKIAMLSRPKFKNLLIEMCCALHPRLLRCSLRKSSNTRVLRFMCKFLHLWSNLLCNIRIKDATLECRWPVLEHHLLLFSHLSTPMLGHSTPYFEFIIVRLHIRRSILAWGTLLKCSIQGLFL